MSISVLIADDHDIIREGIRNILRNNSDYKIVGEAVDGEDALAHVENLKPNILLLDISMPKVSGLDIIGQIQHLSPKTKILIISVHKASAYIMKALKSGVAGYLTKENAGEDLLPALRQIGRNKVFLSSAVSSYLVQKVSEKEPLENKTKEGILTEREEEVLRLVVEGKTAKEIAKVLFISRRTVENHKNELLRKLGLHRTSDLIKYAIKHGIVDIEGY